MNWIRGLFRLWVVLSVLWIAVASVVLRADHLALDYFEARSDRNLVTDNPNGPWLNYRDDYASFTPEQRVALASARHRRARHELAMGAAFLILPSLLLLAFGVMAVWVAKGFKRPSL